MKSNTGYKLAFWVFVIMTMAAYFWSFISIIELIIKAIL